MRTRTQLTCITCKEAFYPKGGHLKQLNCSKTCALKYINRNGSPKKGKKYPHLQRAEVKECLVCGKQFRGVHDYKERKQKYCSKKCWSIRGTVTVLKLKCDMCSKQFLTWDKRQKFCSTRCGWNRRDEKAPAWKGDAVSYSGLHKWVQSRLGQPMECEHCNNTFTNTKDVHWANKSQEYKRDLTDWLRLCRWCHKKYDSKVEVYNGTTN